jgi:Domain of unknown function (DUF4136)
VIRQKEKLMRSIGFLFLGAMTACASTHLPNVLVQTQSSAVASFAPYHTFGFRLAGAPPAPFRMSARSFEVERRIRSLVVAQLVGKGYTEQRETARPDFVVTLSVGYADDPPPGGEPPMFDMPEEGAITIDVFDTSSEAHVWHGEAEAEVDATRINDRLLQLCVRRVLASFPARDPQDPAGVASRQTL